jgi:D-alanyl-D-alanine carboxypeptidase (penicillin-binding protein 5/6)
MPTIYRTILANVILVFTIFSLSVAHANSVQIAPAPSLAAKAYLLKDFNSGQVIATQNNAMRIDPASLTKIMTAYLSFKAIKNGHLQLTQTT